MTESRRLVAHRAAALAAVGLVASLLARPSNATTYTLPNKDATVVGEDQTVVTVYEDTLYDLARKFSLGSEELIRVNPGVDPWLPGAGKQLIIPGRHIIPPGPREGIVVNLPEHRLYYFPKPRRGGPIEVITYPVSIGKMDWRTPLGTTHVIAKQKNPTWYPPESVRKEHLAAGDPLPPTVPPGPDNPLGAFAMRLAAGNGTYLIHGTNNPIAVGLAVTHGCIRMYPDDVAALFPLIPVGTPVRLINDPVKVAWVDGELLLEAHPPVDAEGQSFEPNLDQFSQLLQAAVGDTTVAIHWDYAREVLQKADGVIATVALEADDPNAPDAAASATTTASSPAAPSATPAASAAEPSAAAVSAAPPVTAAPPAMAAPPAAPSPNGTSPDAAATPAASAPARSTAGSPPPANPPQH
ncbi:MAG TPA: L,D-transpeptidase family protein [Steroidobacteraceae bacterium]|jgi:L,D-transpeptidase ErfK/SrfK|nr:L,D-transpeptidase family protein [Steroidobacteraceae bacterium]